MPSVWFLVPAQGRYDIATVCLRQLARTCATLTSHGVPASAVVIADDRNLDIAAELGFGTIERENQPLGRKWNDGYQLAGETGVDFVVPFGTDDWIDHRWVLAQLDEQGEIRCSRLSAVVSENGRKIAPLRIGYDGGDGVRMIPVALLRRLDYRPADEDKPRAIDTAVFTGIKRMLGRPPRLSYRDVHPFQIVDWKSRRQQLNSYDGCLSFQSGPESSPWETLNGLYPVEALQEMASVYGP